MAPAPEIGEPAEPSSAELQFLEFAEQYDALMRIWRQDCFNVDACLVGEYPVVKYPLPPESQPGPNRVDGRFPASPGWARSLARFGELSTPGKGRPGRSRCRRR